MLLTIAVLACCAIFALVAFGAYMDSGFQCAHEDRTPAPELHPMCRCTAHPATSQPAEPSAMSLLDSEQAIRLTRQRRKLEAVRGQV